MKTNEEILMQALKDIAVKMQGTRNLLVDGKVIPAHNKIVGISNKINNVLKEINKNENNNII